MNISSDQPVRYKKLSHVEWFAFCVVVVATILSFLAGGVRAEGDGLLHVYFLNVGQGDAEFIQTPDNKQILIDGGPDDTILQRLGQVMPFNDRSIDILVLTHPHADHVSGLIKVLERYQVDKIIESYIPYRTAEYAEWNRLKVKARSTSSEQAEVIEASAGQIIDLDNGITLNLIFPFDSGSVNETIKNPHDYTVVTRLDYGDERVILTGDMENKVERELVQNGGLVGAQFLKVGHHGSKTSTSDELLAAVRPLVAFISVGAKNRYGHPHPTVVDRLERFGVKYYRTDIDGSSDLQLDGQNYLIKHF